MSTNAHISRAHVHALSEACAKLGASFQPVAKRALENQNKLLKFFRGNLPQMDDQAGEVSLYLLAVIVRIFEQCDGKLGRVGEKEIAHATKVISAASKGVLPFDEGFAERVRAVSGRAQPHILDEALHALFEREERQEHEVELDPNQSGRVFLMLWAATEALDAAWSAPRNAEWAAEG